MESARRDMIERPRTREFNFVMRELIFNIPGSLYFEGVGGGGLRRNTARS